MQVHAVGALASLASNHEIAARIGSKSVVQDLFAHIGGDVDMCEAVLLALRNLAHVPANIAHIIKVNKGAVFKDMVDLLKAGDSSVHEHAAGEREESSDIQAILLYKQ